MTSYAKRSRNRPIGECGSCGKTRPIYHKGQCCACYQQVIKNRKLADNFDGRQCELDGCTKGHHRDGLCYFHSQEANRKTVGTDGRVLTHVGCSKEGCLEEHFSNGFCAKHNLSSWYKENIKKPGVRERVREKDRQWRTGASGGWVREARERQQGKCAICTCPMRLDVERGAEREVVDHWEPGGVKTPRALLCSTCNIVLGHYERYQRRFIRIEIYETYLEKFR